MVSHNSDTTAAPICMVASSKVLGVDKQGQRLFKEVKTFPNTAQVRGGS